MSVAFIGLGNMGSGMCLNLIMAGYDVTVFDISKTAVDDMVSNGARRADSVAEAARGSSIVVSMLPAGDHVLDVYFGKDGVTGSASPGALFIDCSTISVEDARTASRRADDAGFDMVDAPVSGGVAASAAGTLTFMVGGAEDMVERARDILKHMGTNIVYAGGAGNGQVAKIANNMLLGISMIATCEAFDLAERLGLSPDTFFQIASNASGQNWSLTSYCPIPGPVPSAPSNRNYQAGFAVDMMLKDLRLAAQASDQVSASATLGALAKEVYEQLSNDGYGLDDFSVIMRRLREH